MTAHAAALIEKILGEIQRVGALRHPIVRMAHLTAGFSVVRVIKRMQPERIQAVRLHHRRRGASIAAVTSRATKLFGIVNLQELPARMTNESISEIVRFLS